MEAYEKARFDRLCEEAIRSARTQGEAGIGTLAEKRLHAVIKRYLCEDEDCHEVGVKDTRYVSDVRIGREIYEVQTGSFYPMRKKIAYYLENTDCTVTVVHPIAVEKWVTWYDPQTGEMLPRKRSPRKGRAIDLLPELQSLIPHLQNPRLRFCLLLIEAEDIRILSNRTGNRKRGAVKYERIPLSLIDRLDFEAPADFARFLPTDLPSPFAAKDFARLTGLRGRDAYFAIYSLEALGLIAPDGKIGRGKAWRRCDV